jgi:L-fucose isomerase-like protein
MEKQKFLFTRINVDDNHRDLIKIQADTNVDGMQKWLNTTYNNDDKVEILFRTKNILVSKQDLNTFLKDVKENDKIDNAFEWQPNRERWVLINIESLYDLRYPI